MRRADPVTVVGATAATPEPENVKVIGAVPGGLGPATEFGDLCGRQVGFEDDVDVHGGLRRKRSGF